MADQAGKPWLRKYSPEVHAEIVKRIREGNPKTLASRLAGLDQQTLFDWIAQGRNEPDKYPEYIQLAQDIQVAQAEHVAERLARIEAAAKSDPRHWTADAWYLERTMPEEFGKRDKVEIETSKPLVQVNHMVLVDPAAREHARALLQSFSQKQELDAIEVEATEVSDD